MGICWGIVQEQELARLDRWKAVVDAGITPRLVVPVGRQGFEITREGDAVRVRDIDVTEMLAEVALLTADDMTHDQVEARFDGYSVFVPDDGGQRRLPATGFERNATACGATRLLALGGNDAIDLQLRAAAQLALAHGLAIELSY